MSEKRLLSAENIKVSYGEQTVLDIEQFCLYEGEHVGLVGANGAGKTTLLRVLTGELKPECGTVNMNCEPFYFRQFQDSWDSFELNGKEIKSFNVKDRIWQENVSGGENTRIRLAQMFGCDRAVAFIDEPTANLDAQGRMLLAERLRRIPSFIMVSHDRALLNEVCNKIVEISDGRLNFYNGNYDEYLAQKNERFERAVTEYEQYTAEKKRLMEVYRAKKNQAKNMTKKPKNMSYSEFKMRNLVGGHMPVDRVRSMERGAENVLKRIEHMEVKNKPKELPRIRPLFYLTEPPENAVVIRGEHITGGYDGRLLFDDATLMIENKSKVAVVGNNGIGKTTLLNMIMEGKGITMVPKARPGYISQNLKMIDNDCTVLDNAMSVSIQKEDITRIIMARLLISAKDMQKKAGELSGGERMKLAFAMLFVAKVNLLILDEPTNYMDLPSIEAIEKLLCEYEGTLIFTSHDREFVDHIATRKITIVDGKIKDI